MPAPAAVFTALFAPFNFTTGECKASMEKYG
jgi:hypothetical protein